jgi:simple sugar transport system ATP-binding protein
MSQRYGFDINPSVRVNQLSIGERQRVEILKMLYRGCNILIMDEPTTVLTPQEVKDLFKVLRRMADQGKTIILITHKLNEVMEIADRVTVLRKGEVVGGDSTKNLDEALLARMMVEHEVEFQRLERGGVSGPEILGLRHVRVAGDQGNWAVKDVNLTVCAGEIVGLAGVAGNGQRELVEAIAGLRVPAGGSILLEGEDITSLNVREHLNRGINMVPEDRIGMGLVSNLNIMDNCILRSYYTDEFIRHGLLDYKKIGEYTQELVNDFNIFAPDVNHPVNFLSGGNLQKLLMGREIRQAPKLLVASYPVRGLDIAASEYVYKLLLEERAKGTAILLVLEDLDDIFRLADRVAVMYDGQINGVMPVEEADIDKVGALMLGAQEMRGH